MSPALKSLGQGIDIQFKSDKTDTKISPLGIVKLLLRVLSEFPINWLFMYVFTLNEMNGVFAEIIIPKSIKSY